MRSDWPPSPPTVQGTMSVESSSIQNVRHLLYIFITSFVFHTKITIYYFYYFYFLYYITIYKIQINWNMLFNVILIFLQPTPTQDHQVSLTYPSILCSSTFHNVELVVCDLIDDRLVKFGRHVEFWWKLIWLVRCKRCQHKFVKAKFAMTQPWPLLNLVARKKSGVTVGCEKATDGWKQTHDILNVMKEWPWLWRYETG